MREMRCLKGKLEDLMSPAILEENREIREDYLQITLTDTEELIDPIGTLRSVYPNVLQLILEKNKSREDGEYSNEVTVERKSTAELFGEFYEMLKGEPLDECRRAVVSEVAEAVELDERI
jgi:exonuclease SbcD